ncbi:MAG: AraC family transcriptional regulator [Gammaproteobacteria bacterium]|nr:AraC family transcriptional regulator [Gammaproteobacteria bacterium]
MNIKLITKKELAYFNMEHLREAVKGSDFENLQISNGAFTGQYQQFSLSKSVICSGSYSQSLLVDGSLPADMITIGFILDSIEPGSFQGHTLEKGDLIILSEHAEMHYKIPAHTRWATFNISRTILEDYGINLPINQNITIRSMTREFNMLTSIMRQLLFEKQNLDSETIEETFIDNLSQIIINDNKSHSKKRYIPLSKKAQILKQTQSYLNDHLHSAVEVNQMISEFDCSHRTINYAFNEMFGLSLKQYIKITKLNQLRNVLQKSEHTNTSIQSLANSCGFNHMGRLAQDYKSLFNENPRETLKHN